MNVAIIAALITASASLIAPTLNTAFTTYLVPYINAQGSNIPSAPKIAYEYIKFIFKPDIYSQFF
jgi:hypothetical protein